MARLIAALSLAAWPWMLIQQGLRGYLLRRFPSKWTPYALQMITQSLQQEILFFSLPFLFAATQLDWGQLLFTGLACAAALLSTLDPIYEKRLGKRPVLALLFHAYCSFLAALVVLPIVAKVQLENALPLALGTTGLGLLLGLPQVWFDLGTSRERALGITGLILAPFLLWLLRAHVPAAGLSVTEARVSQSIRNLAPGEPVQRLSAQQLLSGGAIAFVAIRAPMGLEQTVVFRWSRNGEVVDRIPAEIHGGSGAGWRTYSRKRNFPQDPRGDWSVDLVTPEGQLIKRLRFSVT